MKGLHKSLAIALPLLALSGCADFQLPQLPATLPLPKPPTSTPVASVPEPEAELITDSVQTLCKTASANKIRAEDLYLGKRISLRAAFASAQSGFEPAHHDEHGRFVDTESIYHVLLTVKTQGQGLREEAYIHAKIPNTPDNRRQIAAVSEGQMVSVTGVIESFNFVLDCSIGLKKARFN